MKTKRLIELALKNIGVDNPEPDEYRDALDHFNMIASNWAFWQPGEQPIDAFELNSDIELPNYYLEIFELLIAAREGLAQGVPMALIATLEAKAKQLTDRLIYRRVQMATLRPTTMVV